MLGRTIFAGDSAVGEDRCLRRRSIAVVRSQPCPRHRRNGSGSRRRIIASVAQQPIHIAVSGLIGAGKSTLVRGLACVSGGSAFPERIETNPYFDDFYRDPRGVAFKHLAFFFEQSLADHGAARRTPGISVQERVIQEHVEIFGAEFFARGYLSADDWSLAQRLAHTCELLVGPPDLLLHIDISVNEAFERLRERARDAETTIEDRYLEALDQRYPPFLASWCESPILRVDASEYDFRAESSLEAIWRLVAARLGEVDGEHHHTAR